MSSRRPATRASAALPVEDGSSGQHNSVVLGPKDRLVGRLYVEGDVRIVGTVDGALEATGDVEIDGGGQVKGPVTARQKLVVGSSGSLIGDVRVTRLEVRDGATFSGKVSMGKQAVEEPVAQEPEAEEAAAAEPEAQPAKVQPKGRRR
ncbi:MAG TPA: polymer-forming cytoskeletal protein [Candidatus Dormibacteraeota bacterium]|nr:polymer-forming cytoskeletal protein [Candidatus Dormibacteraeota bacterium]